MYSPLEDGLIFESLHRSRNTTASVNHNGRRFFVDIHNRASAEKSSEIKFITLVKTDCRYYSDSGGL